MTDVHTSTVPGFAPLRVVAAFDIGSNSIKMTVARQNPDGGVVELLSLAETTRLGAGIETTGRLSEESMSASLVALRGFIDTARRFGATRFIGVATEATRVTENGPAFLQRLRTELGLQIDTISGDREAELTFLGLPPSLRDQGVVIAADIGGASTEIIASRNGQIEFAFSSPIGSGRFTDRYVPSDPPLTTHLATCRSEAIAAVRTRPWPVDTDRLVVLGGTGEYMRRLIGHDWPSTRVEIDHTLDFLAGISSHDLAPLIGASELRARVLPAGVAIAAGIADLCQTEQVFGAASGIRLGLILDALRSPGK